MSTIRGTQVHGLKFMMLILSAKFSISKFPKYFTNFVLSELYDKEKHRRMFSGKG